MACKILDRAKEGEYDENPMIVADLCSGNCEKCPFYYNENAVI